MGKKHKKPQPIPTRGLPEIMGEKVRLIKGGPVGDAPDLVEMMPKVDHHAAFSSLNALAEHVARIDKGSAWHNAAWDLDSFYGSESMEHTLDLALNGWEEGVAGVESMRKLVEAKRPPSFRPAKFCIAGAYPNVPRAVAGDPLNMVNLALTSKRSRKKKLITLVIHIGALCYVDQQALTNRAAVLAAVVDQIEAKGFACDIIATCMSKGFGKDVFKSMVSARVKASHQPVDIARLAFALGHASMFRRFSFAEKGIYGPCRDGLGYGLGCTGEFEEDYFGEDIYVIPSSNQCHELFKTEELAATKGLDFIVETLSKQKCPAFEAIRPEETKEEPDVEDYIHGKKKRKKLFA